MSKYKIDIIHYRDIYGKYLWEEPMIFRRLYHIGQDLVSNSITYIVKRVAIVDNILIIAMTTINSTKVKPSFDKLRFIRIIFRLLLG